MLLKAAVFSLSGDTWKRRTHQETGNYILKLLMHLHGLQLPRTEYSCSAFKQLSTFQRESLASTQNGIIFRLISINETDYTNALLYIMNTALFRDIFDVGALANRSRFDSWSSTIQYEIIQLHN